MSESAGYTQGPAGQAAVLRAADWLSLAATPTFAIMALLTGMPGGGAMAMRCPPAPAASPLSGMALMYLLMGAFHATPWLRLAARQNWTFATKFHKLIQHRRAKRAR